MADVLEDPFALVGTTLDGQYRADQVVGEGGYGVVYRGWHVSLEQPIAIKALKVMSAEDRAVQDALFAKFKDEAKLLYTLSQASLNIVRSIGLGRRDDAPPALWAPYMVLEWLQGKSLADDLAQRRRARMRGRSLDEALALLEPAAEGLSIAHQRRVAHRDIKPANFFLLDTAAGAAPRVKVLDFGIAKIIRDGEGPGTRSPFASFTWLYAAPEQLDPRVGQSGLATDVYSFALLLSELLTNRVPIEGRDVVSLLRAATDPTVRPTPRQRGANVPDAIEVACRRALAVDPKARFASIGELWAALSAARRSTLPPSVSTASRPSERADHAAVGGWSARAAGAAATGTATARLSVGRVSARCVSARPDGAAAGHVSVVARSAVAALTAVLRLSHVAASDVAAADVAAAGHADVSAAPLHPARSVVVADHPRGDRLRAGPPLSRDCAALHQAC